MHMKRSIISPWLVPELTGAQWVEPLPQASYNLCDMYLPLSSMAVCMEVLEMGESGGGEEVWEHTALASLLVLSRAARIANWLLVECRVVVGKACMLMVDFEMWEYFE